MTLISHILATCFLSARQAPPPALTGSAKALKDGTGCGETDLQLKIPAANMCLTVTKTIRRMFRVEMDQGLKIQTQKSFSNGLIDIFWPSQHPRKYLRHLPFIEMQVLFRLIKQKIVVTRTSPKKIVAHARKLESRVLDTLFERFRTPVVRVLVLPLCTWPPINQYPLREVQGKACALQMQMFPSNQT